MDTHVEKLMEVQELERGPEWFTGSESPKKGHSVSPSTWNADEMGFALSHWPFTRVGNSECRSSDNEIP